MKESYLSILLLIILLLSTLSMADSNEQKWTENAITHSKNTIYVDDDNTQGPWNGSYEFPYQNINDAIFYASDGDLIYVFSGIYSEILFINKSLSIRGQQQEDTVINGNNNGSAITVASENVYIRSFTIRNSGGYQGDAGITIMSNATTISDCTIYRTRIGISIQNKSGTIIKFNQFHTNGYGISSSSSAFVTIDQCTFYHNGIGVYINDSYCITIINSYTDSNGIGFLCQRSSHINISNSAARDNDDNEGGMFFVDCKYINIINCYLVHNGIGLNLVNSSTCYINRCNFSFNTHFSCKFKKSVSGIILTNCIFTNSLRYGLYAENSAFTLSWSNIYRNENYGIYVKSSAIDASYNWWGSRGGPAYNGLRRADRGTLSPREIIYAPWLTFPMPGIGSTWDLDKTFQKPTYDNPWPEQIVFPDLDTDNDGAPDWWELEWGYSPTIPDDHQYLDPDNDSLNNIEECYMDQFDSNPFKKDIFLEFDWTKTISENTTNKPPIKEITQMVDAFAKKNITLHVDTGNLNGGEELPSQPYVSYSEIINLYWEYFLHNDLNNPRQNIFHYGIICDYSEGAGFAVIGWNHLNTFIIGAQFLADTYPLYARGWLTTAASMHELGHTFGLIATKYAGIDNRNTIYPFYKEFWLYLRYKSIMNYYYTYSFLDYSDGSHGHRDFNDWKNLDFSFFKNTSFTYLF